MTNHQKETLITFVFITATILVLYFGYIFCRDVGAAMDKYYEKENQEKINNQKHE